MTSTDDTGFFRGDLCRLQGAPWGLNPCLGAGIGGLGSRPARVRRLAGTALGMRTGFGLGLGFTQRLARRLCRRLADDARFGFAHGLGLRNGLALMALNRFLSQRHMAAQNQPQRQQ